jgi:cytochrome oxidase assembly protein ShyY1
VITGWQFLLSRRWAGFLALTIVFALVCVGLGEWQLQRRADAVTENNRVSANYNAAPVPVDELLPSLDAFDESQKWRPVLLEGRYLPEDQVLVRNRPLNGQPGFEILAPFRLSDGTVFVVDRGWLTTGQLQDKPDLVPPAPTGEVSVVVRVKAGEPSLGTRTTNAGEISTIELPLLAEQIGAPTYTGAYGTLSSESVQSGTGTLEAEPPQDEGPHLSYAFQWFVFALFGFFALFYAARQEFRFLNADDPEEQDRAKAREKKRLAKGKKDSDVEDEILDAADN